MFGLTTTRRLRAAKLKAASLQAQLGFIQGLRQADEAARQRAEQDFRDEVDGGHVHWTGSRGSSSGTPVLSYREQLHTAASIAFRIRTGRAPVGYVLPECDYHHCVAPEHVEDEPGRQKAREQLRYLTGGTARPERCVHGHDQAVHGKFEENGVSYCARCKAEQRAAARARETAGV